MGSSNSRSFADLPQDAVSNILTYLPDKQYKECCMLSKHIRQAYLTEILRRYKQRPFQHHPDDSSNNIVGVIMLQNAKYRQDYQLYHLLITNTSDEDVEIHKHSIVFDTNSEDLPECYKRHPLTKFFEKIIEGR